MEPQIKKSTYILALGSFGIVTTEFSIIGILPELVKKFNVNIDTGGWLLSGFALAVAIGGPFMNLLLSRYNRKFAMCLAQAVFITCNLLSAFAPTFTVLLIVRVVSALFHPVYWGAALTTATKDVDQKLAPKALSIVIAGISIATVFGVPLSTYMSNLFDYHASFYLCAGINLFALICLVLSIPSLPVTENPINQSDPSIVILRRKDMWLKIITAILILSGMFASYGYLGEYLTKVSKLNGAQLSLLLLLFGAAGILGNWLTGIALTKGVERISKLHILLLIGIQLIAFVFGSGYWSMIIIIPLWGLIHTGGFLTGNVYIIQNIKGPGLDFLNGIVPSIFNVGIALGILLGGYVIASYGAHNVIWMSVFLLVLGLGVSFIKTAVPRDKADTTNEIKMQAIILK